MGETMTPKQALDILVTAIMKRTQGSGDEHAAYNMALNTLLALIPKEKPQDGK